MIRTLKALWQARKGFRWSLYFVRKNVGLIYSLDENAVAGLLGYVAARIAEGKRISPDWELHINFNWKHKSPKLDETDFRKGNISPDLLKWISSVDSGWMVPVGKPMLMDLANKRELPLGYGSDAIFSTPKERLAQIKRMFEVGTNQGITLSSLLDEVLVAAD